MKDFCDPSRAGISFLQLIRLPQYAHGNCNGNGATARMYAASAGKAAIVTQLPAARAGIMDGFNASGMGSAIECLTLRRKAGRARTALPELASA